MFISSPVDRLSQLWTKRKPTAPLLQRIAQLAHEAHTVLQQQLQQAVHKSDFKVTTDTDQLSLAIPSWVGTISTSQRAVTLCGWGVHSPKPSMQ